MKLWVLTSSFNDYYQHGKYLEAVFVNKPSSEQIQKLCNVTAEGAEHILAGGGRIQWENHWYHLEEVEEGSLFQETD